LAVLFASILSPEAGASETAVERLTKVLPDDVLCFVATSGGAALEGDFRKSALGQLWYDPALQAFATSIKAELFKALEGETGGEDASERVLAGLSCGQLVLGRPTVLGVARVKGQEVPLCAFGIVDAGAGKPDLAALVTQIETSLGDGMIGEVELGSVTLRGLKEVDGVPLYWGWIGDHLVFAVNDAQGAAIAQVVTPRAAVTGHLAKVSGHGDVVAMYLDAGRILATARAIVPAEEEPEVLPPINAVIEAMGIDRLGRVVTRAGFSGEHLVTGSFIEAPAPRKGLPAVLKPVDVSVFGKVDSRAVRATALNCDLAGLYDTVMKVIKAASPDEAYLGVQKRVSAFESEVGFGVRKDLLASLGGPMVIYSLPAGKMVEAPMGGIVAIAKLEDAALFEKTMVQIGGMVAGLTEGGLQVSSQTQGDGRTTHVWSNPALSMVQMMPTWSVAEDHVVIGTNMALCRIGVQKITGGGTETPSLLETEGFKRAAADLPDGLVSLTYADSATQLTQGMMQLQQFWPMATMAAARAGIKLPVMLPSLTHITERLKPSCQYSYVSEEGFHSRYAGAGVELSLRSVAVTGFGVGALLPALARVRQLAFRMTSGTNMVEIGKACRVYADDHDDKLPPNLEALVEAGDLPAKCLESKRRPDDFDGPSYVYIGGQTLEMNPGNIVAYEDPRFCLDGVNVLFLDSHVEFMKPEAFRQALKETCARLGREMPDIQFREEMEADW
jgi:prepilin-type processing-associated H-X9-DG protein